MNRKKCTCYDNMYMMVGKDALFYKPVSLVDDSIKCKHEVNLCAFCNYFVEFKEIWICIYCSAKTCAMCTESPYHTCDKCHIRMELLKKNDFITRVQYIMSN